MLKKKPLKLLSLPSLAFTVVQLIRCCSTQPPPFLLLTTPIPQVPFYYPPLDNVFDCRGVNEGRTYQPWPSHFITPTTMPIDADAPAFFNYESPASYNKLPDQPIECTSQSQLRNGSCTTFDACVGIMGGTINASPQCPSTLYCCMLPTCALIVGAQTRYGHCRPKRTCPGTFDTVMGLSVGCTDPNLSPCCVSEEVNITCPRNFDRYVKALVQAHYLVNTTAVATPQRVMAWAPFLLTAFNSTIDLCIYDCHKFSFLHFVMTIFSEVFMFSSGPSGFYKQLLDWKGVSKGLLPASYFSYYSPYVFANVVQFLFKNYELEKLYGDRSLLSAHRIFSQLNYEIGVPFADYSKQFTLLSWQSYKYFASAMDCAPIAMDGPECSQAQGLCFIALTPAMMSVSEYLSYCPLQLPLQPGDCSAFPANKAVCCAKPLPALKYGANLVKNEFNNVVVAIHQIHYLDPSVIGDLVTALTSASAALYTATGGRAYFRTVTILSQWNATHGNATYETYKNADFKVLPDYSSQQPRALQLGQCGEPGQGVFLSQNQLRQEGAAMTVAKMFALNRWGIGDEVASSLSELTYVPDDQVAGSATFRKGSSCSADIKVHYQPTLQNPKLFDMQLLIGEHADAVASFAFRPDLLPRQNAEFCATTTIEHCDDKRRHNAEPNTPHNRICNRTSTLTAILGTADFDRTQNSPRSVPNTAPTFRFVGYPLITDHVIAIVADFSGSVTSQIGATMLNAIISFLHIAPDEVKVVLVSVGPKREIDIPNEPTIPLGPFVQTSGALHYGRQALIERAQSWMDLLRSSLGPKNTSILEGVEQLVSHYLTKPNYRLKILVFSDFMASYPSDNRLLLKIQQGGYSVWPVALWSRDKLQSAQPKSQYPLYFYMQMLANSTFGRWQFIANPTEMLHWYYAFATFMDDLDLGMSILIEKYQASPGGKLDLSFTLPSNYALNTSIIVNYDSSLLPASVGPPSYFQQNCSDDIRGHQKTFRVVCRLGDLASNATKQTLSVQFGMQSKLMGSFDVVAWVVARALEYGAMNTGEVNLPLPWLDPWSNRVALSPDRYVKADAKVTSGLNFVFERSARFRYPRIYAIISSGKAAVLNCYVEYDLYISNSTFNYLKLVSNGQMYDDGDGEDGFANDGVYTALLVQAAYNGSYSLHVRVRDPPFGASPVSALGCFTKPSVAIVGFANNQDAIANSPMFPTPLTFYKSAGSFDVVMPPDAVNVFPLGLIRLQNCDIGNVVKSKASPPALPQAMTVFCNVFHLKTAIRYNLTITYYLSVSYQIADFTQHLRYSANSSVTVASNSTLLARQSDGSMILKISFDVSQVIAPYYYLVVWATDGRGNYATRSEIRNVIAPTSELTTSLDGLPQVTDITTGWPRPDDAFPAAVVFSCIAGGTLAIAVAIISLALWRRRQHNKKMWARDGSRIFLPSGWPVPHHSSPQPPRHQNFGLNRNIGIYGGHPHPSMAAPMQQMPGNSWNHQQQRQQINKSSQHRQRLNHELFFPRPDEQSAPNSSGLRSSHNNNNSGKKTPTAERENAANSRLANFYTRANGEITRRY